MKISRREFFREGAPLAGLAVLARAAVAFPGAFSSRPASSGPGRFFGAQTHFGQFRTASSELLDQIKDAGFGWIRDEVYWEHIEKEKGVFRFPPAYDAYLKAARARDIEVLLILDFGNPLYSGSDKTAPASDPERAAFARYCREVIGRYKPLGIRHFEIWNEPNASTFWRPRPNPEDYTRLLETAYRACKEADPKSIVLGCSTAGTDLDFIGKVLAAGGGRFMDAVSFHPYCQPLPPERKLTGDLTKLERLASGKPLWITEVGYPTYPGPSGVDEETQANFLVRTFLLARSAASVERVSWYDFQNDGDDAAEGELNFGLVRLDRSPKPAYRACKTMISLVGSRPLRKLDMIGSTYLLRFEDGREGGGPLAFWKQGGTETVEIPLDNGTYRLIERDGESRIVEAKGKTLEVTASEKPGYIVQRGSR